MPTHIEPTANSHTDTIKAIAAARAAQKLSLRAFAAELGVSQNSVAQWENGVAAPTYERLLEWLRDARPWVHQLGAAIANVKYAELLAHTAVTVAAQPTTEGN